MGRQDQQDNREWIDRVLSLIPEGRSGEDDQDRLFSPKTNLAQLLFAASNDAIVVSKKGRIILANQNARLLFGLTDLQDLIESPLAYWRQADDEEADPADKQTSLGSAGRPGLVRIKTSEGYSLVVELQEIALGPPEEKYLLGIYRRLPSFDSSAPDEKRALQEEINRSAFSIFDAVWEWNLLTDEFIWHKGFNWCDDGSIQNLPRTRDAFLEWVHPDDRQSITYALKNHLENRSEYKAEFRLRQDQEAEWLYLERGSVIERHEDQSVRMLGALLDITEQSQIQQRLARSTRLESIGQLAGGIAHDFNNLIGCIMGHASFLLPKMAADDPTYESLDKILQSAHRAAGLTEKLLAFARGSKMTTNEVRVNELIEETLGLLSTPILANINVTKRLTPNLPTIQADSGQIVEILMNLILNAIDAMPDEGRLDIASGLMTATEDDVASFPDAAPGTYVYLAVADSGTGMSREVIAKIFDPFFTTKPPDKGTGLGLATTFRIVSSYQGFIQVTSKPDRGSRFRVLFPALSQRDQDRKNRALKTPLIMVIDANVMEMNLARSMIEFGGFSVINFSEGPAAIEVFKRRNQEIDLVLLGLTGDFLLERELYDQLRQIQPSIKIILSAGKQSADLVGQLIAGGAIGCIEKPYNVSATLQIIEQALH